jgi:PAS domain S-box-containing protein
VAAVQDSAGRPLYLFLQVQDVTLRRAAVDALRASEERFRLLVAGVVDYAIFMLDPEGRIASWNAGAERIKGYTSDEALGQHFRIFYSPEAQAQRHPERELEEAAADGRYEEEGWRIRKDGSRFWANVVITPVFDVAGDLVGFAKFTRDVTERHRVAEAEARVAQEAQEANNRLREADELKSEFMAITAHELRNPIAVLGGFASILLDRSHQLEEEERRQLLRGVGTQAARLNRLVEDLLVASRLDAGALEIHRDELDLGPLIAEASSGVGGLDGTPIEVDCPPVLTVVGDRDRLNQMLVNYISNAVKYGSPPLRVEARPNAGFAEVRVLDAGGGVEPEAVPRLFEKFSRATKSATGGTGLGLFIVRGLARAQGGDAWYEPGAPTGACFAFSVPAAARRS